MFASVLCTQRQLLEILIYEYYVKLFTWELEVFEYVIWISIALHRAIRHFTCTCWFGQVIVLLIDGDPYVMKDHDLFYLAHSCKTHLC